MIEAFHFGWNDAGKAHCLVKKLSFFCVLLFFFFFLMRLRTSLQED